MRVAVIQHPPVFLNLEASLGRAVALIAEAAAGGARVIAFPETWLPGYPLWLDESPGAALWDHPPAKELYRLLVENSLTIPGPACDRLAEACRSGGVQVVMGAHERRGGSLYNALIIFGPEGAPPFVHRKLVPTHSERLVWGRGDGSTLGVVDTPMGSLGGLICWEHWMPLARAAMHARGETIHVAQWPWVSERHQIASRHYAFEGQCFVIAAGTVLTKGDVLQGFASLGASSAGAGDGACPALSLLEALPGDASTLLQRGGSAIIGPDLRYVVEPVLDRACILYADLDPAEVTRGRMVLDTSGHYSRPDVFRLEVDERPQIGVTFRGPEPD